ncbi:MAG: polyphosphate polymerase domain-containing protein [Lachnospiraceae bacterium]|nr:polyphosphate polymerase domain-containing protein [Lachnospiraceae bacterium]
MAIEVFNRYEKKYMIDDDTYQMLQKKLSSYMRGDKHHEDEEFYTICNVYFDTKDNELIRRSIDKPIYKEKLRLRSYGVPDINQEVFLEIKKKYKKIVNKRRTSIVLKDAYEFIRTGVIPDGNEKQNMQVLKEIQYFIKVYGELEPAVYIAYDRKALFGIEEPNLRITFDKNIRTRRYDIELEKGDAGREISPEGKWLMEIKSHKAMPLWLSDILNMNNILPNSFSKYGTEYRDMVHLEKNKKGD